MENRNIGHNSAYKNEILSNKLASLLSAIISVMSTRR